MNNKSNFFSTFLEKTKNMHYFRADSYKYSEYGEKINIVSVTYIQVIFPVAHSTLIYFTNTRKE